MGVNGIYGLSGSGLDIESMVKVGMMGKQSEFDKLQQKYTKNEWVKAAYIETYGTIQTFNNATLSKYKMSNNMNAKSATSSQESVVTATANANAANMTHVVEVGQLASAAYIIGEYSPSRSVLDSDGKIIPNNTSTALKDVLFRELGVDSDNKAKVTWTDVNDEMGDTAASETAFSFTINDGVNGMMTSTNPNAVTVTANANIAEGKTYEVSIESLAKPAETEMTLSNINGEEVYGTTHVISTLLNPINRNPYLNENFTLDNLREGYEKLLAEDGKFLTDEAINFTFYDGSKEDPAERAISISFTYDELFDKNTTYNDLFTKIQNKLDGTNINLSFKDTYDGLQLSVSSKVYGANSKIGFEISTYDDNLERFVHLFQDYEFDDDDVVGKNAVGKIKYKDEDGNDQEDDLNFQTSNTAQFGDLTIVAKKETTDEVTLEENPAKITTVAPKAVSVTYQQLLDGYTFNDLVSDINSAGTNVKAVYDSVQDKFSFYNKESGEKHQIGFNFADAGININEAVSARTLEFFASLGLRQSNDGELGEPINVVQDQAIAVTGQDAKVKIDGVNMSVDANNVNVAGVVYKFTGTNATTYLNEETGNIEVKSLDNKAQVVVSQDTNEVVDNVKSFIEDYNKLLSTLQDKYNEKPYTTYKPLTDAQRAEMTDDQIEKWEEKAQAGMLYHDRTLGKVIDQIRDTVSETVYGLDSKYNNIYSIGISTTGTKGQLVLDEDKLRAALADDPDAVYNIFAKLDEGEKVYYNPPQYNADGTQKYTLKERNSYNGIAQRLGDIFTTGMKSIKTRAGTSSDINEDSDLNNLLRELQTKMSNFRTMMNAFEDALYKKYDKMEVALSTLGAQLNFVTSSFSS